MKEELNIPVPASWSQVSLRKGKELFQLNITGMTENEYIISAYNILTGDDASTFTGTQILSVKNQIISLLNQPINKKLKYEFKVGDQQMYLQYDITNCNWTEFTHLERALEHSQANVWQHIERVLGILIRPKIDQPPVKEENYVTRLLKPKQVKYKKAVKKVEEEVLMNYELQPYEYGLDYMKRCEAILDSLTVDDVHAIVFFCLNTGVKFINNIADYLHPAVPAKQSIPVTGQPSTKILDGQQ